MKLPFPHVQLSRRVVDAIVNAVTDIYNQRACVRCCGIGCDEKSTGRQSDESSKSHGGDGLTGTGMTGNGGRDGEAGWRRESSGMVNQPPQAGVSSCIPCLENTPLDSPSGPRSRPPWHPVARAPSSVAPEAVPIRYQVNTPEPPLEWT